MVSKNNNKHVLATLALMLLSFGMASLIAINTPHYARAQGVAVEGGGNATNATTTGAAGNATNATSTSDGETAAGTQIGGPLSLYGGGGGQ